MHHIERLLTKLGPAQRGDKRVSRSWSEIYQQLINERCEHLSDQELAQAAELMVTIAKKEGRTSKIDHGFDEEGYPTIADRLSDPVWNYSPHSHRIWLHAWGAPVQHPPLARRGRARRR